MTAILAELAMKRMLQIYLIIIVLVAVVNTAGCEHELIKQIRETTLPAFEGGYCVKQGINEEAHFKYLNYRLDVKPPSVKVIRFYDTFFKSKGYEEYSLDGYGKRRWEQFNPKSGDWEEDEELPGRYIATWVDRKKEIRIVLVLMNEESNNHKDEAKTGIMVDCKVTKFFDSREIEKRWGRTLNN